METKRTMWPRVILGFAIAPLVVPIAYFLYSSINGRANGISELVGTLLTYGPYAYLFAALFGIPAFLLVRRSGYAGPLPYALAAGLIGLMGASLLFVVGLKIEGVLVGTLAGLLAGIVFYLVAIL